MGQRNAMLCYGNAMVSNAGAMVGQWWGNGKAMVGYGKTMVSNGGAMVRQW